MHVLLTGARAPVCLEWARAFSVAGWQVSAADSLAWPLTRASRHVGAYHALPEPRRDVHAWGRALRRVIEATRVDLVLPTCEEVFYLAHQHRYVAAACRVLVDDFDKMRRLHHKGDFAALTSGWRVTTPESIVLTRPEDLTPFAQSSVDWVFKPAFSRFAARTLIRPSERELRRIRPATCEPWVAQRFVAGREYCSYSILCRGGVRAHAVYHPKYRVGHGAGIYFERVNPPGIFEFVQQFGRVTEYFGQVGFDFIEGADGRMHVLECNPRATSGLHLFSDQPLALVASLQTDAVGVLQPHAGARGMVGFAMALFGVPNHGWRSSRFWRDFLTTSDAIARRGDRTPSLFQLPAFAEILWRALRRRQPLLVAATEDIEWNGEELGVQPC